MPYLLNSAISTKFICLVDNYWRNISVKLSAYFHFSHCKSLETLSCHSDESTWAMAIKKHSFCRGKCYEHFCSKVSASPPPPPFISPLIVSEEIIFPIATTGLIRLEQKIQLFVPLTYRCYTWLHGRCHFKILTDDGQTDNGCLPMQ